jgi:1,4-dihydroxy-2-naphthoate octaprenyltransferase
MRTARGIWLEVRIIPVLLWSFSALTLGTALAADDAGLDVAYWLGAVALGVLIQGLLAHCVNELVDWRSGTDRYPAPRVISGGSKVLVAGLLSERGMGRLFWAAFALTTVLGLALVASRGLVVLPFGLVGVAGAIVYSAPPVRAAYRPVVGEAVAFTCVVTCVLGAAVLQGGEIRAVELAAAAAVAAYAVAMLMLHHDLDRDADLAADPPKRTTVAVLGPAAGRRYTIAWAVAALAAAVAGAALEPALAVLALAYAAGLVAQVRRVPGDVESVTRSELAVIAAGVGGALTAAAILQPPLTVAVVAAVALVATELRVALPPQEHTPA